MKVAATGNSLVSCRNSNLGRQRPARRIHCQAHGAADRRGPLKHTATACSRATVPDPIPVMLIGRLAVATTHQGRGIARAMVRDAILRTLKAAEIAGIRALPVHSPDSGAATFYRHLGFRESPLDPLLLAPPLSAALKALDRQ